MNNQKILLFNASNMESFPVYPYAFIQVPAVARQSNIAVVCTDLLGIPQDQWADTLQASIKRHNPVMILVTLRNTDSLNARDYEQNGSKAGNSNSYFPIEETRDLISVIRGCSDLKIALGGFGFSVMPEQLMRYLRPDFGLFGDPDGFFEHFEHIQAGNLKQVPNLLYFQGDQFVVNRRVFYPPLARGEYTPQVIEQMMVFYEVFPSPGFQGAPVEIMRGCGHSCVFCSEPHVKGKQVRYRDLSAVMGDIEMLVNHNITRLYIISSELNPEGNAFVLELADRIHAFNEWQPDDRKVSWFGANYLLNFSTEEFERLYRSGFTGGWFDITALDDENARAMQTPYRNKHLSKHLKTYADFKRKQAHQKTEGETSTNDSTVGWSMFLGNPATTVETIRSTLQFANQNGIAQRFDQCSVIAPVRVFDYEDPDPLTLDVAYSVTTNLARTSYQQRLPSFAYPPALLRDFGTEEEIAELFKHIGETYLSTRYRKTRQWQRFIQQQTSAAAITNWLKDLTDAHGIGPPAHLKPANDGRPSPKLQQLFVNEGLSQQEQHTDDDFAKEVVEWLLAAGLETFPEFWEQMGFPNTLEALDQITPYDLAVTVFNRWSTVDEIYDELMQQTRLLWSEAALDLSQFCIQVMLYKLNISLTPKYKGLFIPTQ